MSRDQESAFKVKDKSTAGWIRCAEQSLRAAREQRDAAIRRAEEAIRPLQARVLESGRELMDAVSAARSSLNGEGEGVPEDPGDLRLELDEKGEWTGRLSWRAEGQGEGE